VKALVTGAGGFCGHHLIQRLEGDDVEVHSVGTRVPGGGRHHLLNDVTDLKVLTEIVRRVRPDYVFHLAGVTAAAHPAVFYRVNSEYAATLLAALDEAGVRDSPVLLTGTSAEYGVVSANDLPLTEDRCPQPFNHYGISKLAQTHIGLEAGRSGRQVVIVRPFNVVGPGMPEHLSLQSFATQITSIRAGLAPPVIQVGNLGTSRDFVDVRDAVVTYWDAIRSESCRGQVLNVCSGRETRLSDALSIMLELAGVSAETRHDSTRSRALEVEAHYGSTRKLDALLGVRPLRPLVTTLSDILAHAQPVS
jgi:GDP-4-dehydro-6-deoxy-D-mannose reductase